MKISIYLLFLPILITACKKTNNGSLDGHTIVQGKLLDAATLEPISGGKVSVERGYAPLMDTITDSNGFYSFDIKHKNNTYSYSIIAQAEHYFGNNNIGIWYAQYPNGKPSPIQYLDKNKINNINIKLPPEGFIHIHMKQVEPYQGTIECRLSHEQLPSGVKVYNGQNLDNYTIAKVPAERESFLHFTIIRNQDSIQQYIRDTIFVPRFDTLYYTIEF